MAYSQENTDVSELKNDWKLISEKEGIELYMSASKCEIQHTDKKFDYAFLKLVNTNNVGASISFQLAQQYSDGSCQGCDANAETVRSIYLNANETKLGDCNFEHGNLSVLIKNPFQNTFGIELNSIELLNLIVTKK